MSLHSIGYLFREGLKSLWKNRTMTIASVGVLIACLLMTGVAGLLSMNLSSTMTSIEGSNTLTVYLREDVPSLTAVRIGEELRQINNIAECTFVPKDDALSGIMQGMDSSSTLFESFTGDNNPLPDAYEISLEDLSLYDQTISAIKAVDGVDRISDYRSVAVRLKQPGPAGAVLQHWHCDNPGSGFPVHHCQHGEGDDFFPPHGNQHYEIRGRYQWVCADALHCRGCGNRPALRGGFRYDPVFCLRLGGRGCLCPGSLAGHCGYPPLCVVPLWGLSGGGHAVWPVGRHHFHWQVFEKRGQRTRLYNSAGSPA